MSDNQPTDWDHVNVDVFIVEVGRLTRMTTEQIVGARKLQVIMPARLACYWGLRQMGYSYPAIAHLMGRRNHTTIFKMMPKVQARHRHIAIQALTAARKRTDQ